MEYKTDSIIKRNEFLAEHLHKKQDYLVTVQIRAWKRYSRTRKKTVKQVIHTNLFLTCGKDKTQEVQTNMLLFKACLFITRGKIQDNSTKAVN